ncbi:synergin gamma-like isoform X1 [Schistocerca americana]|uniref:synergin gamma-like isoform X1 n=1 Tax=Schistocerca americana TaxID=7009 RepID=UPI001F4F271A|nr:synergin gamma-like isoform X1 [Schistocerca americana]
MAERFPFPQQNFQQHMPMPVHNPGGNILHYPTAPLWQQQHHHHPQQQQQQQQHQQQQQQQLLEDQKHREYLKQQQKLRLISSSANKAVSADKLIENLLEKKETFQLKSNTSASASHVQVPVLPAGVAGTSFLPANYVAGASTTHNVSAVSQPVHDRQKLPTWLTACSNSLPPIYSHVWSLVLGPNGLADTGRLFPVLITSGLTADVLGHIWSLANKEVPGQLTELELYTVLALIALAQNGCPFSSLGVLNLIPQAPVPNLNVGVVRQATVAVDLQLPGSHSKMKREELNLKLNSEHDNSSPGCIAKETKTGNEDSVDDFTDFQSFTVGTSVTERVVNPDANNSDKLRYNSPPSDSSVQKNHSLNTESITHKCPNVIIVGNTSHSRGIGSRLANHSLGTPKQSKMRHKHHHHHHHHSHKSNQLPINSVSPAAEDEFTDFQQAETSLAENNVENMSSGTTSTTSPSGTYVLKESAIRAGKKLTSVISRLESSNEVLKDRSNELVTSASGTNTISPNYSVVNTHHTKQDLEKPVVHQNMQHEEHSVKDIAKRVNNVSELMAVEEDKYSALRELSTVERESPLLNNTGSLDLADDFGDFVTAEVSSDDPFAAISSRDSSGVNRVPLTPPSVFNASQTAEFPVDWTAFHSSDHTVPKAASAVQSKSASGAMDNIFNSLHTAPCSTEELHLVDTPVSVKCSSSGLSEIDIFSPLKNLSLNTNCSAAEEKVLSVSSDLKIDGKQCDTNDKSFPDCFQLGNNFNIIKSKDSPSKVASLSVFDEPTRTDILCSEAVEDEFGDFVGTDVRSGELSSCVSKEFPSDNQPSAVTKDILYDTHSVSSLEFPTFSLSRHGSLPSLDLKVYPSGSEQPGASHSQNVSPQAVEHEVTEWCRCVQSCLSLLQAALNLFSSVTSEEVLEEVLHIGEGKDYLNNLLEVYGVCQRVKHAFKLTSAESKKLESLFCEVDQVWDGLHVYYYKADISVHRELPSLDFADNPVCGICLTAMEGGSGNTSALEYGGQLYHAACANLWVNCVECSLPCLANSLL